MLKKTHYQAVFGLYFDEQHGCQWRIGLFLTALVAGRSVRLQFLAAMLATVGGLLVPVSPLATMGAFFGCCQEVNL